MAIYTTFFLCEPEELPGGFPGWRLPLAEAVVQEFRNPFTGEMELVATREPEWPAEAGEALSWNTEVVAIQGRYEDYLEERLPPFVRQCTHWAVKGLTELDLEPLLEAAGLDGKLEAALYAPPPLGAIIHEMPPELIPALGSHDLTEVAAQWTAALSVPEDLDIAESVGPWGELKVDEALELVRVLLALGRKAGAGQRMYLLTET